MSFATCRIILADVILTFFLVQIKNATGTGTVFIRIYRKVAVSVLKPKTEKIITAGTGFEMYSAISL